MPEVLISRRDLGRDPIPHLVSDNVAGVRAEATTEPEMAARALSDELIAEVREANVLLIGAPMFNFSIPSGLRSWFDHVLRPRVTFAYGEAGPKGLLPVIPTIVVQSRGGLYSEGPAMVIDFQEPYLRQLLGLVGITDVAFVHAEKIGFRPEAHDAAIAHARFQIDRAVERIAAGAGAPRMRLENARSDAGDHRKGARGRSDEQTLPSIASNCRSTAATRSSPPTIARMEILTHTIVPERFSGESLGSQLARGTFERSGSPGTRLSCCAPSWPHSKRNTPSIPTSSLKNTMMIKMLTDQRRRDLGGFKVGCVLPMPSGEW